MVCTFYCNVGRGGGGGGGGSGGGGAAAAFALPRLSKNHRVCYHHMVMRYRCTVMFRAKRILQNHAACKDENRPHYCGKLIELTADKWYKTVKAPRRSSRWPFSRIPPAADPLQRFLRRGASPPRPRRSRRCRGSARVRSHMLVRGPDAGISDGFSEISVEFLPALSAIQDLAPRLAVDVFSRAVSRHDFNAPTKSRQVD